MPGGFDPHSRGGARKWRGKQCCRRRRDAYCGCLFCLCQRDRAAHQSAAGAESEKTGGQPARGERGRARSLRDRRQDSAISLIRLFSLGYFGGVTMFMPTRSWSIYRGGSLGGLRVWAQSLRVPWPLALLPCRLAGSGARVVRFWDLRSMPWMVCCAWAQVLITKALPKLVSMTAAAKT